MLADDLYRQIIQMPVIDVHSHIVRDQIAASSLDELLFYHMMSYPLAAVADKPPQRQEGKRQKLSYEEYFGRWPMLANTGFAVMLRTILRDLYEYDAPMTLENLPRMQECFARKAAQADWARQICRKANLAGILSSHLDVQPLAEGQWDGDIRFTVEKGFGSPSREYISWSSRLLGMAKHVGRPVTSVRLLQQAAGEFYGQFDWSDKHALVAWISSMIDFTPLEQSQADALLVAAAEGKPLEQSQSLLLEGQVIRAICQAIRGRTRIFQICYGVQFLTPDGRGSHPLPRAHNQFASSFAHILSEFPDIHFNMLNGFHADDAIWSGMAQAYHNLSLAGFWWEAFYPSFIERALSVRLDMVPLGRLMGFFSDGRSAEYIYGRLRVVQKSLACALAEKVDRGYYSADEALDIARKMMFDVPKRTFLQGAH